MRWIRICWSSITNSLSIPSRRRRASFSTSPACVSNKFCAHQSREIDNLLPNSRRQRRTCYALCHILYPVSAAHTSIFRMDSNSTSDNASVHHHYSLLRSLFCHSILRTFFASLESSFVDQFQSSSAENSSPYAIFGPKVWGVNMPTVGL